MNGIRRIDAGLAVRVASAAALVSHQAMPGVFSPPRLLLAYPAPGVSMPTDNATAVFRYSAGDASDPLDVRSFTVLVDGVDRSSRFRATADAAWGRIADRDGAGIRAHEIRGSICSVRRVCTEVVAIVTVIGAPAAKEDAVNKERRRRVIDLLLEAARKLLRP